MIRAVPVKLISSCKREVRSLFCGGAHTEEEAVEASIGHVFIDEKIFFSQADAKQPDQVPVLLSGEEFNLIPQLFYALVRC